VWRRTGEKWERSEVAVEVQAFSLAGGVYSPFNTRPRFQPTPDSGRTTPSVGRGTHLTALSYARIPWYRGSVNAVSWKRNSGGRTGQMGGVGVSATCVRGVAHATPVLG
jgi:hypothetical protein